MREILIKIMSIIGAFVVCWFVDATILTNCIPDYDKEDDWKWCAKSCAWLSAFTIATVLVVRG